MIKLSHDIRNHAKLEEQRATSRKWGMAAWEGGRGLPQIPCQPQLNPKWCLIDLYRIEKTMDKRRDREAWKERRRTEMLRGRAGESRRRGQTSFTRSETFWCVLPVLPVLPQLSQSATRPLYLYQSWSLAGCAACAVCRSCVICPHVNRFLEILCLVEGPPLPLACPPCRLCFSFLTPTLAYARPAPFPCLCNFKLFLWDKFKQVVQLRGVRGSFWRWGTEWRWPDSEISDQWRLFSSQWSHQSSLEAKRAVKHFL